MSADDPTLSPAPTSRRRGALPTWAVLAAFVALAGAGIAFWYYGNRPAHGVRADDLRADLEARLPPGSTSADIETWFRDRGITDFGETVDIGQQKSGYRAVVPNDTLFDRADIEIFCRTDKAGRLLDFTVDRVPRNPGS